MATRKPALGFIFITLMVDVLGIGLIIPVAPKLVQFLQGGTEEQAAGVYGYLVATYGLMQFAFAPLLGVLSDWFGRRPVILIALLGSGIDFFAQALSPTVTILFITRAINGLSGASITAANAYIADVTPPERRAAGFGMIGAAFGIGFVLGPLMGGWLGAFNIRWPFYAAGILALVNWAYGMFVLPESLPREMRSAPRWMRANPLGAFTGLRGHPMVQWLALSLFLVYIAQFALQSTWVLYTSYRYHWSPRDVGISLALVGVGAAIVQGGLARKIVPKFGEKRSMLFGLAVAACAYVGYGLAPYGWVIYVIIAIASIGSILGPAAQSLITKTVGATEQGTVQGAITGLQSAATVIGPILGGQAFEYFVSVRAPFKLPGAAFFIGAILTFIALATAAFATTRRGREPKVVAENQASIS